MGNQTKWSIDQAHSEIAFKVRHLMIAHVKGTFKTFDANIYTTSKDFTTAEIDLWIDAASITTGDAKRDEHLQGADFFDVQNHKQITFTASSISKENEDSNHDLWGDLTIKGITKKVKFTVQFGGILNDPWGNEKAGFSVSGKINRKDWGLAWNTAMEKGGLLVGEDVTISCEVELVNAGMKDLVMELEPATGKKEML
ncbi:MAG: YceI family protein [Bacteroidia bacterium]|nr:YceI family protein [Bacteroidia bacterium]